MRALLSFDLVRFGAVYRWGFSALLFATVLALASCANDDSRESGSALLEITPGVGLSNCRVGDDVKVFIDLFGGSEHLGYVSSPKLGVQASLNNGKISHIFFLVLEDSREALAWKTVEGVGPKSVPEDVLALYGQPDSDRKRPGKLKSLLDIEEERVIEYLSKGVIFTFSNGRLMDIRVFRPKAK